VLRGLRTEGLPFAGLADRPGDHTHCGAREEEEEEGHTHDARPEIVLRMLLRLRGGGFGGLIGRTALRLAGAAASAIRQGSTSRVKWLRARGGRVIG
jgi:hypothetical protein